MTPAFWNVRTTVIVPPLGSALVSPLSTTFGCGPVRYTAACAGTAIEPPASCTDAALPGAETETSLSALLPALYTARNMLAELPGGSGVLSGPPRMKALSTLTESAVAYAPFPAGWNWSTAALSPASHAGEQGDQQGGGANQETAQHFAAVAAADHGSGLLGLGTGRGRTSEIVAIPGARPSGGASPA